MSKPCLIGPWNSLNACRGAVCSASKFPSSLLIRLCISARFRRQNITTGIRPFWTGEKASKRGRLWYPFRQMPALRPSGRKANLERPLFVRFSPVQNIAMSAVKERFSPLVHTCLGHCYRDAQRNRVGRKVNPYVTCNAPVRAQARN